MLCGTFSWAASGPLIVIEQTMKAPEYLNITVDQLYPYNESVFPTRSLIFLQSNTPRHKARIMVEIFEKHKDAFELILCLLNSLDLNPTEHTWDVLSASQNNVRYPEVDTLNSFLKKFKF